MCRKSLIVALVLSAPVYASPIGIPKPLQDFGMIQDGNSLRTSCFSGNSGEKGRLIYDADDSLTSGIETFVRFDKIDSQTFVLVTTGTDVGRFKILDDKLRIEYTPSGGGTVSTLTCTKKFKKWTPSMLAELTARFADYKPELPVDVELLTNDNEFVKLPEGVSIDIVNPAGVFVVRGKPIMATISTATAFPRNPIDADFAVIRVWKETVKSRPGDYYVRYALISEKGEEIEPLNLTIPVLAADRNLSRDPSPNQISSYFPPEVLEINAAALIQDLVGYDQDVIEINGVNVPVATFAPSEDKYVVSEEDALWNRNVIHTMVLTVRNGKIVRVYPGNLMTVKVVSIDGNEIVTQGLETDRTFRFLVTENGLQKLGY
jgi:hypothetical protein